MVCATSKASDQPAHMRSLVRACWSIEYSISIKLLTEHHLESFSLTGGCTGSSESTHVKMPHCWKSHVMAQIISTLHSTFAIQNILTCMFSPVHHGSSYACQADVLSGNFLHNLLQYRPHSVASRVTSGENLSCIWWKNAFHMCCTENKMSEHLRFWYFSYSIGKQ